MKEKLLLQNKDNRERKPSFVSKFMNMKVSNGIHKLQKRIKDKVYSHNMILLFILTFLILITAGYGFYESN